MFVSLPGTYNVDLAGLELVAILLLLPPRCTTMGAHYCTQKDMCDKTNICALNFPCFVVKIWIKGSASKGSINKYNLCSDKSYKAFLTYVKDIGKEMILIAE